MVAAMERSALKMMTCCSAMYATRESDCVHVTWGTSFCSFSDGAYLHAWHPAFMNLVVIDVLIARAPVRSCIAAFDCSIGWHDLLEMHKVNALVTSDKSE